MMLGIAYQFIKCRRNDRRLIVLQLIVDGNADNRNVEVRKGSHGAVAPQPG
jgi:hypothetical protein